MKENLTILVVEPNKPPRITTIEDSLKAMQDVVGGYIEARYPFSDYVALICNEEEK